MVKNKLRSMGAKNPFVMLDDIKDDDKKVDEQTSITAGGGTPDTQAADKESERLGKEAMRKRMPPKAPPKPAKNAPSAGANNYKLPTRPADGSGTGI